MMKSKPTYAAMASWVGGEVLEKKIRAKKMQRKKRDQNRGPCDVYIPCLSGGVD
jgi:hypothetical protein